jgi:hypothetical protein
MPVGFVLTPAIGLTIRGPALSALSRSEGFRESKRRLDAPPGGASEDCVGGVPEWLKGTDCKSVGYAYVGSNPTPSTIPEAASARV